MNDLLHKIVNNRGFSYNQSFESPKSGFMVALDGYETIVPISVLSDDLASEIFQTLASKLQSNQFVGAWVDNDKVYFDVSENVDNRDTAIELARERNQLGIFALDTFETIKVKSPRMPQISFLSVVDSFMGEFLTVVYKSLRTHSRGILGQSSRRVYGE